MAPLTTQRRNSLPDSDFVFPDERKDPIQSLHQAEVALTTGMHGASPAERAEIRRKVAERYPALKERMEARKKKD